MAESSILTRLDGLKIKYEELGQKLTDPEVIADVKSFVQYNKEYKELEPIIETSERFRKAIQALADAKDIETGVENVVKEATLDINAPMYDVLGRIVDKTYKPHYGSA